MSLRKEKSARLKLSILDHTIQLTGKKSFDALHLEEICGKVKISKVTLFKYFPRKEDILLYYFRVWCLKRTVELRIKPREGIAGIHFLFDKLSEECEMRPGIILSLIGYLADLRRAPKPFPLKPEEKKLLFPDHKDILQIEILSVDQMFENFCLEAIFKKEITRSGSTRDFANLFATVFYGSVLTAHLVQLDQLKFFFRRNVEMVMKGLQ